MITADLIGGTIVAVGAVLLLLFMRQEIRKNRPDKWRARDMDQPCEICGEKNALISEKGMRVCEECKELLP